MQAEAGALNMKRLVAGEFDLDAFLRSNATRLVRNAEDFDSEARQIALQNLQLGQTALANAVALANRVNNGAIDNDSRTKGNDETHDKQMDANSVSERERTVRAGDLAIDRQWNVDEVAELVAKTPVFMDAIAGAVSAGVAKAMSEMNKQ